MSVCMFIVSCGWLGRQGERGGFENRFFRLDRYTWKTTIERFWAIYNV